MSNNEQPARVLPASLLQATRPVVAPDGHREGLPLHYGWPADEQDVFEGGRGFAYLGEIGVVTVTGPDRLSWLTTLSSQTFADLKPGDCIESLLLDAQGRVIFQMAALDDGETTWLFTERMYASELADFLQSMQFMLRVEVRNVSQDYLGFLTANQSEASAEHLTQWLQNVGGQAWRDPWPTVVTGGAQYFQGEHPGHRTRFRLYVCPKADVDAFVEFMLTSKPAGEDEEPLQAVGLLAAEATRVAAWRPLRSMEVDERTLPAELDWLRTAVHLEKGCYRGQESVARIVNLGKPPRRLVFLQLDGSAENLPQHGDAVTYQGRQVGVITSVGRHWEMGPIALALVKRNLSPDAQVMAGGVDAAQEVIVPVDGRSDHAPKTRPGAGLKRLDPGKRDIRTRGPGAGS